MLQSPGIEMFEESVTPASSAIVSYTNGVATLGFATRGPVNKLVRIDSPAMFSRVFGEPVEGSVYSHILANSVLAQNSVVYFMRIASQSDLQNASCYVLNPEFKPACVAITTDSTTPYFEFKDSEGNPTGFQVSINNVSVSVDGEVTKVGIDKVVKELKNKLGRTYSITKVCGKRENDAENDAENVYGIIIKALGNDSFDTFEAGFVVSGTNKNDAKHISGTYCGIKLGEDPDTKNSNPQFKIMAKNPGSGMNGAKVTKFVDGSTWTVSVVDRRGVELEKVAGIKPEKFVEEVGKKMSFIEIVSESPLAKSMWEDGTYLLGEGGGLVLSNGTCYYDGKEEHKGTDGTDGYPVEEDTNQLNSTIASELYRAALDSAEFVDCDSNTFSILATPDIQTEEVQTAAVNVCSTRGDAIYLIDVPLDECEAGKSGIDSCIDLSSPFDSSYAAMYYGWFYRTNPYDTANNIACPASCFVAPRMIAIDDSSNAYYAPAGIQNGTLSVTNYIYSPDQEDRDKMVGGNNVVNPITYSNTRGVVVMAQKTTDRSSSPLNRVGIRRMTNNIKRELRSKLESLLFQPNNENSREIARRLVDDTMYGLRGRGFVENYNINVQSGVGADRNVLNVYLSYAVYGLIEKIYVYVSITDAGVEVTEAIR